MSSVYSIWYTIEEEDEFGDMVVVHVESSEGPFDTLEEAESCAELMADRAPQSRGNRR